MADDASDVRGLPADAAHFGLDEVVSFRAGDLPAERAKSFEEHLRSCVACRRLVQDAAVVLAGVDLTVRAAESPFRDIDDLLAGLRRRVASRASASANPPRQPSQRFWLPMAGVAAVVVSVALLQLLMVFVPRWWRKPSEGHTTAPAEMGPAQMGPAKVAPAVGP